MSSLPIPELADYYLRHYPVRGDHLDYCDVVQDAKDLARAYETLTAEMQLACALIRQRARLRWNPSGYHIDGELYGDSIEAAIRAAAAKGMR